MCGDGDWVRARITFGSIWNSQVVDSKRRDVRVVEGARLESDQGDAHEVTLKHLATHSIRRFAAPSYSLIGRCKRRYFAPVSGPPYTVLTQFSASLLRERRDDLQYASRVPDVGCAGRYVRSANHERRHGDHTVRRADRPSAAGDAVAEAKDRSRFTAESTCSRGRLRNTPSSHEGRSKTPAHREHLDRAPRRRRRRL
jgi:hypothetical protein